MVLVQLMTTWLHPPSCPLPTVQVPQRQRQLKQRQIHTLRGSSVRYTPYVVVVVVVVVGTEECGGRRHVHRRCGVMGARQCPMHAWGRTQKRKREATRTTGTARTVYSCTKQLAMDAAGEEHTYHHIYRCEP